MSINNDSDDDNSDDSNTDNNDKENYKNCKDSTDPDKDIDSLHWAVASCSGVMLANKNSRIFHRQVRSEACNVEKSINRNRKYLTNEKDMV